MKDLWGRNVDYMRISITDRCNLRCKYCMPQGVKWLPMAEILTYEEILRVCQEAVSLGICKFKITGGEPLVRKGCPSLVERLKKLPGVSQVTMTTNGILLKEQLGELMAAGLDGVNISLDTLDAGLFREITGSAALDQVLESIDAAVDAGLKVKINTVLQEGKNDREWSDIAGLAGNREIDVRFIEMMPIGYGKDCSMVPNPRLLKWLTGKYPDIAPDNRTHGNGPAVYYKIPGFKGSIGFISALHGKFCAGCNRIRMTSTGELKPCLCYGEGISIREAVRGGTAEELRGLLGQAILKKPGMHCFEKQENITENRKMAQIGG